MFVNTADNRGKATVDKSSLSPSLPLGFCSRYGEYTQHTSQALHTLLTRFPVSDNNHHNNQPNTPKPYFLMLS